MALGATDIVRQRGIGITGQLKVAQMAESMGVPVHGGDPHVILGVANDPLFEAFMGLQPEPPKEEQQTVAVSSWWATALRALPWSDRPVVEPDWDEVARTAMMVIE